jgi:hypothetical protein
MTYELAFCELHHPALHGISTTDKSIQGNYLVSYLFDLDEFYNDETSVIIELAKTNYQYNYLNNANYMEKNPHDIIKNYWNIINKTIHNFSLDIVETKQLESGELVAIKKTFWLKIFQRKWKNICKERKRAIQLRKSPKSLRYRQIHGKWPKECIYYPIIIKR